MDEGLYWGAIAPQPPGWSTARPPQCDADARTVAAPMAAVPRRIEGRTTARGLRYRELWARNWPPCRSTGPAPGRDFAADLDASPYQRPRRGDRAAPSGARATCASARHAWLVRCCRPGICVQRRVESLCEPPSSTPGRSNAGRGRNGCTAQRSRDSERTETCGLRHRPNPHSSAATTGPGDCPLPALCQVESQP